MEHKSTDKKLVAGALLILAGALLFLDTFDLVNFPIRHYIFSWKTLLIGIGLIILASKDHKMPGYILIGLGIMFWLPSFLDVNIRLHQVVWPLVLIAIGFAIITRRGKHRTNKSIGENTEEGGKSTDYIDDLSLFGGGQRGIYSQNFKGGNVTAIFGGSEINMKDAEMAEEEVVIDIFTMFGGTKLVVPQHWNVKSDALSIFGGLSDKRIVRPSEQEKSKTLLLKGLVLFGGVEIKSI